MGQPYSRNFVVSSLTPSDILPSLMTVKRKRRRPGQRMTTGIRPGEKASDYQRLTIRLPEDVRDELEALSAAVRLPQWRVIVDAIRAYAGSGPTSADAVRRDVRK